MKAIWVTVLFAACRTCIFACSPAVGPLSSSPTFSFIYSPPVAWTYNSNPSPGQSFSESEAQQRINTDVDYAILKAFAFYGIPLQEISFENAITPLMANITTIPGECIAGQYVQEGGAVLFYCDADYASKIVFSITSSVKIESAHPFALSQWEEVAFRIWTALATSANVRFYDLFQITV